MSAAGLPPMPERELQRAVIDLAEVNAWTIAHFHDSRRQVKPGVFVGDQAAAGFPDLVMVRAHRLIFAELKGEKGRVKPDQQVWLDLLKACALGREVIGDAFEVYLWRPSDWPQIARVLAR